MSSAVLRAGDGLQRDVGADPERVRQPQGMTPRTTSTATEPSAARRRTTCPGSVPYIADPSSEPRTPPAMPAAIAVGTPSARIAGDHGCGENLAIQAYSNANPAVPTTRPQIAPKRNGERSAVMRQATASISSASTRKIGMAGAVCPSPAVASSIAVRATR